MSLLDIIRVLCISLCSKRLYLQLFVVFIALSYELTLTSTANAQSFRLQEVLSINEFLSVTDIAVGHDGSMYIADPRNFSLSKYDAQGQLIQQVGGQGMAPGEFINGPYHVALMKNMLIASDQKGNGILYCFDQDLNYIGSNHITALMDMDVASDEQLYLGITDLATLNRHVVTKSPSNNPEIIFEIKDAHKHNVENQFLLLSGHSDKIVIVFQFVNRVDVYNLSGRILNRLSVNGLPPRYHGRSTDMGKQPHLPDHVVESISYVPGGIMFTSAVLDYKGNLFLEHGGETEKMPSKRSVYVMDLEGNEKGVFQMPPFTSLLYIDATGYAYAEETRKESTVLKKYKIEH